MNGEVVGFLQLLATDVDFFHDGEQHALLHEMSLDISFAMESMEREKARRRAEQALRASEERFSQAFNVSPAAITLTRLADGKFIDVNETFLQLLGYRRDQVIGHTSVELEMLDADARAKLIQRQRETNGVRNVELWLRTQSGSRTPILFSSALLEVDGEPCILTVLIDITERKRAEENLAQSRQKYSLIFDRAPFAATLAKLPDGVIVEVNTKFESLFGFRREEVLGRTSLDLGLYADPEVRARAAELLQRQGFAHGLEIAVGVHSGEIRFMLANSDLFELGGEKYVLTTVEDITERKRADQKLEQLARRTQTILDSAGEGIFGLDRAGRITFINATGAALLKTAAEDLVGLHGYTNHHHSRKDGSPYPLHECPIYAALRDGTAHHIEDEVFWRSDGSSFPVEYTSTPLREGDEIVGAVVTFNDISGRKRAEAVLQESEERFRLVFENSGIGIALVDPAGHPIKSNRVLQQIVGYSQMELSGMSFTEFTHPGDVEKDWGLYAELLEGKRESYSMDKRYIRKDGQVIWARLTVSLVRNADGKPEYAIGTVEEITERKQAEDDRLARAVAERARTAKTEFLSRMRHELRTPLNSILGFAQLMMLDDLSPAHERGVNQILRSGRHLLDLINEVLEIARIEAGRMQLSPETVRLQEAAEEALDLIRPLAEARGISVKLYIPSSGDVHVFADRQRLKQVLLNLFSNAVKYNRIGGAIQVNASLTLDGHVRLQVRDTGAGIPPEKLSRLFVPFDRLDADAQSVEGTGLGLALSNGLIEAMGGRIGVESQVGEGSSFWFELKLVTERLLEEIMAEVEESLTERMRSGRGRVLYVEDNLANINLVEAILERLPQVELITAMQGRLAMSLAQEHRPNVILLDLHLPDMHGSDVLRTLKSEGHTRDIPVVIISADAIPAHVDELLTLGAHGYLTKPIDVREFLRVVEEHLGSGNNSDMGR